MKGSKKMNKRDEIPFPLRLYHDDDWASVQGVGVGWGINAQHNSDNKI